MLCFLQDEELLPTYLQLYDVVLTCDASMDVPNAFISSIIVNTTS